MSEILDKIRIIQEKTGCSVVKGKELLDMAGGDVDLAVAIFEEEKAKQPASPAPQPAPQQQPKTLSQGVQTPSFHTEVIDNKTVLIPTNTVPVNRVTGNSNYRPQAPEVPVPRPNDPGARIAQPKQYQPMNQPTQINIPQTSGQKVLAVDNSPKSQVVRNYGQQVGQPSEIAVPHSSGQTVIQNAQPQNYNNNYGQPMPTVIPRPVQPGMGQQVQQANPNEAAPVSISVPRPVQPGEHLNNQPRGSAPSAPIVIPRPVQPVSNQPMVIQANQQPIPAAQPVNQPVQGQPVVLGSIQPPKSQPVNNRPGQPVTKFKIERPETQFFQSNINSNNTSNQSAPTSINVPHAQKQNAHVVIKGVNDQPKTVQTPIPQRTPGPNSHFVMAKPNSQIGAPTPVVISESGQIQNGLQSNQRIQQAPQPSGNAPSVIPLPSRPGSRAVVNTNVPGDTEKK